MVEKAWEASLAALANGPGQTEQEKCDRAERAVKEAIAKDKTLSELSISVFAQGSYKARTNIRSESDVDICVRLDNSLFPKYPDGLGPADFGYSDAKIPYADYKAMVGSALRSHFGAANVGGGDKAFDVHANTYRVDADVVAAFEYRWHLSADKNDVVKGIAFNTNSGRLIVNYPDHSYRNGVTKNDECSRRYKRIVRILKGLRATLEGKNIAAAKGVPSFLLESLAFNIPNGVYETEDFLPLFRDVLISIYNATKADADVSDLYEVNKVKPLFGSTQAWTREQANQYVTALWNYIGYQ